MVRGAGISFLLGAQLITAGETWSREGASMFRGAGGLGLDLRLVGRRQFVASRVVVPRKRWMFPETIRCSHRELDFSTDRSKTDGESHTQDLGDRKLDAGGVLTERSILESLRESAGSEREQDDVHEKEVDDVDSEYLGVQAERWRRMRNVALHAQKMYKWECNRPAYEEDDNLFLFNLISSLHRRLLAKIKRQQFRKMRAGAKVRLTDWKKFSREMDLEGGRGPVTDFFDEFLQDGEMTRDAWETLQRIWTGEEAAPDCTAQRRHGGSKAEVFSDPVFQGAIRDPILQAMRASCKLQCIEREIHDPDDIVSEH